MSDLPKEEYRELLAKLDPKLATDDPAYAAAVVLIAASRVGTTAKAIAAETEYPYKKVLPISRQYHRANIFHAGKVISGGDWFDEETGGISFWADVCCGLGLMQRVA